MAFPFPIQTLHTGLKHGAIISAIPNGIVATWGKIWEKAIFGDQLPAYRYGPSACNSIDIIPLLLRNRLMVDGHLQSALRYQPTGLFGGEYRVANMDEPIPG